MNKVRVHVLARAARSVGGVEGSEQPARIRSILSLAAASFGRRPGDDTTIPTGFDPGAVVLFEAIIEAAFLVANADGDFDEVERSVFERVVVEACDGAVSSHQIAALVNSLERQLQRDGIDRRIATLATALTKREQALEVLRVAALVAEASEPVSTEERDVLNKLASGSGLNANDLDSALSAARRDLAVAAQEH